MSARQRARIAHQVIPLKVVGHSSDTDESSSEGVDTKKVVTTKAFQFETSSSSSGEESDTCDENVNVNHSNLQELATISPGSRSKAPSIAKTSSYDELAFLDTVIMENSASQTTGADKKQSNVFIFEDSKSLDLSAALKRRQGQHQAMFNDDNNDGPARRHRNRGLGRGNTGSLGIKRFLFGTPSEDWLRPPAFLAGGMGMDRLDTGSNENEFTFTWSAEFRFLHSQYQFIEGSGDPNLLVMFLAHFPYHPQGLMQLSRIYAGMGQPEKSFDLVRRTLYVLECASMESFRPSGVLSSQLDPQREENKIYFEVLIRYMQECSAQGCHSVAMEVCRYLLSLWPGDSSKYQLLLSLDYYIVAAQQHDRMLTFCGLSALSTVTSATTAASSADRSLDNDMHTVNDGASLVLRALNFSFVSPYRFCDQPPLFNHSSNFSTAAPITPVSLQDLPNWWFSLALSTFTAERRQSTNTNAHANSHTNPNLNPKSTQSTQPTQPSATLLLYAALLRWPCILQPLFEKLTADTGAVGGLARRVLGGISASAPWRKVLEHELFRSDMNSVPPALHSFLRHVSEIYAIRNVSLWGQEDVLKWLLDTCTALVTTLSSVPLGEEKDNENSVFSACVTAQQTQYARLLTFLSPDDANTKEKSGQPLLQYTSTQQSILPDLLLAPHLAPPLADINPLDPSLDDPQYVLSGAVRFREFMDTEGRFLFPVPAPYVTTTKARNRGMGHGRQNTGNNNTEFPRRPEGANIDLNLPLMQLFLATLFPWIFVPPIARL